MAYELAWSFNTNQLIIPTSVLDASRYSIWWVASALVGGTAWVGAPNPGRWTLYASSDSVDAGIDSTDRWLLNGAFDDAKAKLVRAAAGAHSWIVLRSPTINGAQWYLTFDFLSAADTSWLFFLAKTAPTGGSIALRPTSVDEVAQPSTSVMQVSNLALYSYKMSMGMTSRGDFWSTLARRGATFFERAMWIQGPVDYNPLDRFPIYSWIDYQGTTPGAFGTTEIATATATLARSWDGTDVTSCYNNIIVGDRVTNTKQDHLTNSVLTIPMHVVNNWSGDFPVYRGRLQDCKIIPFSGLISPQNQVMVATDGSITHALAGSIFLPCNTPLWLL